MSNFGFLRGQWPDLYDEASRAERIAAVDPRASCFYARRCLELTVDWLYQADSTLRTPYRNDLAAKLTEPTFANLVGPTIGTKMDVIRRRGNAAVHRRGPVSDSDAIRTVTELFHVMYWLASRYSRRSEDIPPASLTFDRALIPPPLPSESPQRLAEIQRQAEEFARQQAELAQARRRNRELDAELAALREEIAKVKAANAARPDTHDYSEAETRDFLIDLLLKEAGWTLDGPNDREFPLIGMPDGDGRADYVLWDDDGRPLGVVEAKRTTRDPRVGQQQAKLYADCLEQMYGQRPVIFYTNGYQTYIWDDLRYPPRPIQGFYTREELRLLVQRRASAQALAGIPINDEIVERHYQFRAIRRVAERFEKERQRQALLVMATGAGKTRTAIALVDLLARANWVKRVLFLADRQALVKQAYEAFKQHLPGMPAVNLLVERDPSARVMVSTYPTIMNMINETDGERRPFGPGFFDLIIIDEAHRSIYQKYGALFDYFDGLLLGLTATPKDEVDRNTYRRFNLEEGVPTDSYSLDEAVADGYLVPPKAIDVPLKFLREGIKYDELSEEEKEEWDALDWSDDGSVPTEVSAEDLNRFLFNKDTVDKVIGVLMAQGQRVAGGDRLGKTIIFAKNQRHAAFIAERFDAMYPEYQGEFARVITHQTEFAQDLIDKFSDPASNPHIAISVDMLDTGIDVPEVVNLVFFKLVRSKTKFWQMLGRGTRLCRDLFGPNQDKQNFYVFDLCQNVEFFNQEILPPEDRLVPSLSQRLFERRADLILALDRNYPHHPDPGTESAKLDEIRLRWDTARRLHQQVRGMNRNNILVRPHLEHVDHYSDFANWATLTPQSRDVIVEHLAPLPTAFRDDDDSEEAKRFDLLMLRLQLARLGVGGGYDRLRQQVQDIAAALLRQTAIPVVGAAQQTLDELAGDEWWHDVTLPMLERARRRIRSLVKLIEKSRRNVVYIDVPDELGVVTETEIKGVHLGTNRERFEAKVRTYLRSHEDELAVQKLRRNRQLTTADLAWFENLFVEFGFGTRQDIEEVAAEHQGLGIFLRSLSGLDRTAAAAALDEFQRGRTLTASQLDFLALLTDTLARRGLVEVDDLYRHPFTRIASRGPEDLFPDQDIDEIVAVLHKVRATAIPTAESA